MPKLKRLSDWTSRIIVRTRVGIVFVRKGHEPWHLPGGKKDSEDRTPLCTAKRELPEETGIPDDRGYFRLRFTRSSRQGKKNKYDIDYFEAAYPSDIVEKELKPFGDDGEETTILSYAQIRTGTNINTTHLSMLRRLKCLRPPNSKTRSRRCM